MHSRAIGKARMIPWPSSMLCCMRQCDMWIHRNKCYAVVELLIKNILCFEIKFPGMTAFWRLHNSPSIIADYLEKLRLIKKSSRRHCKFCIMRKTAISSGSCESSSNVCIGDTVGVWCSSEIDRGEPNVLTCRQFWHVQHMSYSYMGQNNRLPYRDYILIPSGKTRLPTQLLK